MSYEVVTISFFDKQLKRLSKKYPSIKSDIAKLGSLLSIQPEIGTPLGNNFFKIRMAISSKGKGKSGGARVITCVKVSRARVYLASIYDKSEKSDLTLKELKELYSSVPE